MGFVPTMGALHSGHLSLINKSRTGGNITVSSIFVNPTQFNDKKDYDKYPVTIENDILLLNKVHTDILFLPSVTEIYPNGLTPAKEYNLGYLEKILEGFYRPGHFQGVCRVVHRLLEIIQPDDLYMGQKDYQQCLVVQKLIDTYQLQTRLHIIATEREDNGLAMSSRNLRLSGPAKEKATAIYKTLNFIKQHISTLSLNELKETAASMIINGGFQKLDYVEICDAKTLMPVKEFNDKTKFVALAAAFIDDVRLIDNLLLN
ncbi:MAG TPA: pantoate--beta-alanine ligase [Panacibacter sp.]|nr:pantoate--beta-alanine ligase [Panacibacter sp.]